MRLIAPNYYKKFKCIADKCQHSCCIGWEIDIDEDTLKNYNLVKGDFGKRLNENIEIIDDIACFKLEIDERCPFLNKKNLCDIILNLGEKALCQICSDHPRFRNFYDGATEIGLGLCCGTAAELIISQDDKVILETIDDCGAEEKFNEEENDFIEFRNKLYNILQNRDDTVENRIKKFLKMCNSENFKISNIKLTDFLLGLERLDNKWTNILNELRTSDDFSHTTLPYFFNTVAEQLLVYFTYRHLSGFLEDGRLSQRASFVVFSYKTIELLCRLHLSKNGNITYSDIAEYARLYSLEIEYSEENTEAILNIFNS